MKKYTRQRLILDIIQNNEVKTQSQLSEMELMPLKLQFLETSRNLEFQKFKQMIMSINIRL